MQCRKFETQEDVTILGTDNGKGFITNLQPTNVDEYLVYLYTSSVEKVYPYHGNYRLYPEWMLEKVIDDCSN